MPANSLTDGNNGLTVDSTPRGSLSDLTFRIQSPEKCDLNGAGPKYVAEAHFEGVTAKGVNRVRRTLPSDATNEPISPSDLENALLAAYQVSAGSKSFSFGDDRFTPTECGLRSIAKQYAEVLDAARSRDLEKITYLDVNENPSTEAKEMDSQALQESTSTSGVTWVDIVTPLPDEVIDWDLIASKLVEKDQRLQELLKIEDGRLHDKICRVELRSVDLDSDPANPLGTIRKRVIMLASEDPKIFVTLRDPGSVMIDEAIRKAMDKTPDRGVVQTSKDLMIRVLDSVIRDYDKIIEAFEDYIDDLQRTAVPERILSRQQSNVELPNFFDSVSYMKRKIEGCIQPALARLNRAVGEDSPQHSRLVEMTGEVPDLLGKLSDLLSKWENVREDNLANIQIQQGDISKKTSLLQALVFPVMTGAGVAALGPSLFANPSIATKILVACGILGSIILAAGTLKWWKR